MTMKAIEISSFGAPSVLRPGERPVPVAGTGELLIRVAASGINRPDVLQRTGNYPVPAGASDIPDWSKTRTSCCEKLEGAPSQTGVTLLWLWRGRRSDPAEIAPHNA